jgi:hypothetical protein
MDELSLTDGFPSVYNLNSVDGLHSADDHCSVGSSPIKVN